MPHVHQDPHATPSRGPGDGPGDELVLAAVERAGRHRARDTPAVPLWAILDHLAIARRSGAARDVRSRLGAMHAAGLLERSRRHGVPTWELTRTGRQRVRRAGTLTALPESPQHRAWRNARTAAAQEIERFRAELSQQLRDAALLLKADPPPRSDAWLELAESLQRACRRVASSSHCLREWAEPDDAHADIDEGRDPHDELLDPRQRMRLHALRAGRRNVRLWDDAGTG